MDNGISIEDPLGRQLPTASVSIVPTPRGRETQAAERSREPIIPPRLLTLGKKVGAVLAGLVVPTLLLLLWRTAFAREWVSPLILPAPSMVWATFRELYGDGTIKRDLVVSAFRILKGFGVGAAVGIVIGSALGASKSARAYFNPTFFALSQINVIAWIPLFILVFGIDEGLKVAIIAWSSSLPVALTVMKGVADIPNKWFELARVQELNRYETLRRVTLPATIPIVFTGLRAGLGAAWISLIVVELIASSEGVGFLVVWGRQLFQMDVVIVAIVIIGTIGLVLDVSLRAVERRLQRWQHR